MPTIPHPNLLGERPWVVFSLAVVLQVALVEEGFVADVALNVIYKIGLRHKGLVLHCFFWSQM